MRPISCSETSVRNYHYTLRNSQNGAVLDIDVCCNSMRKSVVIHVNTCNLFDATDILKSILFYTCILVVFLHISNIISHN